MNRGIYTIIVEDFNKYIDFELPQDTEIGAIIQLLIFILTKYNKHSNNIDLNETYGFYSKKLNKFLDPCETLNKVGLWEGSILYLKKVKS